MVNGIIGKKVGMTQLLQDDGTVVPVTVIQAGPCVVVQKKTAAQDGYDAVQLGFVEFVNRQACEQAHERPLQEGECFAREVLERVSFAGICRIDAGRIKILVDIFTE